MDSQLTKEEQEYLNSLNDKERKAFEIAKNHLGSSFHIIKSNGFIEWKKSIVSSSLPSKV
jgi:hypothetical protein